MRRSPSHRVPEDPEWAIAMSVQLHEDTRGCSGTAARITARRHPTGWFISARHPAGLSAEELSDLRHFVCVRVYLLLHNGPIPGAWERGSSSAEWIADLPAQPSSSSVRRAPTSWSLPRMRT